MSFENMSWTKNEELAEMLKNLGSYKTKWSIKLKNYEDMYNNKDDLKKTY